MTILRYSIRNSLLTVSMLTLSAGALAQSAESTRAVEARNYELALSSIDSDTDDSTSSGTLGLNATVTQPLGSLFAISLSGYYSQSNVRTGDILDTGSGSTRNARPPCDFDNSGGDITLFARRPTLGKVAVSYGTGKLSPDCGSSLIVVTGGDDELSTDNYRFDAEVYLGDFTVGASRTSTDLDGVKLETNTVTASWYPFDSLKVSVSGNDLYDQDTYGIMFEHQPEFMGDSFGLNLGYSNSDQEPKIRTIYLGLTYFFGTQVELKARDRRYR